MVSGSTLTLKTCTAKSACTIVESSLAAKRAVWIQNEVELCGPEKEPLGNAHLNVAMAKRVIKALQKFVEES